MASGAGHGDHGIVIVVEGNVRPVINAVTERAIGGVVVGRRHVAVAVRTRPLTAVVIRRIAPRLRVVTGIATARVVRRLHIVRVTGDTGG